MRLPGSRCTWAGDRIRAGRHSPGTVGYKVEVRGTLEIFGQGQS